jgi:hypothetical protein
MMTRLCRARCRSGTMRTVLPICVFLTVCVALPISASAKQPRSASAKREFLLTQPCPAQWAHACPGYVKDHIKLLACGGPDARSNMQWQTKVDAKAKDRWETKGCAGRL